MAELTLHPDRALPTEPAVRDIARELYQQVKDLPLVCMHGHVDPKLLLEDKPFTDAADLFVTKDHYVIRMLVSQGMTNSQFGVPDRTGAPHETDPREMWRRVCEGWKFFRGTPSRYWLEHEISEVLGLKLRPSAETADELYDQIGEKLAQPEFKPRALFDRFKIEILATTDPATSPLAEHQALADQGWGDKVVPTMRPDSLYNAALATWNAEIDELSEMTGIEAGDYHGFLDALRKRRQDFIAMGSRATDHACTDANLWPLEQAEAERMYAAGRAGTITEEEAERFYRHLLYITAELSCDDGLVMQFHPGSVRNYDSETFERYGADAGIDIPQAVEFTQGLRPLLDRFGHHPNFRFIAFTMDEDAYSRELAPLAGVFPAMKLGAPWWFLDTAGAMERFREAVTDTAGFYNTAGFVDDTRAFASIPARHDLARRVDCGFLAGLVARHSLDLDEAAETAVDMAYNWVKECYPALRG